MLRFGPETGPVVVVALPLFEEANRMRAFAVTLCRLLAKRGIASVLPDLPGQSESMVALETVSLDDWRTALAAVCAAAGRSHLVSMRSGALLDDTVTATNRWHLAPVDGAAWVTELLRPVLLAEPGFRDFRIHEVPDGPPVTLFGNAVARRTLIALQSATVAVDPPARVVRLDGDPKPADRHVSGTPLWRRAEPGNDPALAALLSDDIAAWIAQCEG